MDSRIKLRVDFREAGYIVRTAAGLKLGGLPAPIVHPTSLRFKTVSDLGYAPPLPRGPPPIAVNICLHLAGLNCIPASYHAQFMSKLTSFRLLTLVVGCFLVYSLAG